MSKIRGWRWTRYIPFSPTFLNIDECLPDCYSSSSDADQKGELRIKNNDADDNNTIDKGNSSSITKL